MRANEQDDDDALGQTNKRARTTPREEQCAERTTNERDDDDALGR